MLPQLYDCFKHWSAGGRVFIFSDPHFDDPDCKLMAEDWPSPLEQVEIINNKIGKNDTLIILGDIGNPAYMMGIKAGYKVLITGNHDSGISNYIGYFDEVYGGPLFIGEKILLSHEPIDIPFGLNIHGHTHALSGLDYNINHYNVCANCVFYEPQNLSLIIKSGVLKRVDSIHRLTIDEASKNPINKKLAN